MTLMQHMYGIIGEDDSDVSTLKVFIERLRTEASKKPTTVSIRSKGYGGCSEMLRKTGKQLHSWEATGVTRVVICYDSDREKPAIGLEILQGIVVQSGIGIPSCLLIPVQELEAWLLADHAKLKKIFGTLQKSKSWPKPILAPEKIKDPKERLEKMSRTRGRRALYSHAIHNEVMASVVDIALVRAKCPSFGPLDQFVTSE